MTSSYAYQTAEQEKDVPIRLEMLGSRHTAGKQGIDDQVQK